MSVLEIHTWTSRADALEAPDRVVFDLDPGPKVGWKLVVSAAEAVRARLRKLGFAGFVKATGGKGLHVVVPLVPGADWPSCLAFTRLVAESLVAEDPDHHTTALPKEGREAKILIDYYRNRRGSTSIAAYSTRARAGAPVAAPLDWDELADFSPDRPFTLASLPTRLARLRRDPWRDFDKSRKPLAQVLEALPPGRRPRAAPVRRSTR
jgi:bifunctional non-homologous end joining protein LigD